MMQFLSESKISNDKNLIEYSYNDLPDEITILFFQNLPIKNILNSQFVCWNWYNIINDKKIKANLINLTIKRKYKYKNIKFNKSICNNYGIFRKVKLKIFKKQTNGKLSKYHEIKSFCRLFNMFDLQWKIGSKFMLPPHKLILEKINNNNNLEKIQQIDNYFSLLSNEKIINVLLTYRGLFF